MDCFFIMNIGVIRAGRDGHHAFAIFTLNLNRNCRPDELMQLARTVDDVVLIESL